jgi:hypothetical protein
MSSGRTDYERSDMDLKVVAYTVIGLLVFVAITGIVLKPLFGYKSKDHYIFEANMVNPERPGFKVNELFPEPRLQYSPNGDMAAFRKQEEAAVSSYGWVDKGNGVARIPVEEAMDLYLQQGEKGHPGGKASGGAK